MAARKPPAARRAPARKALRVATDADAKKAASGRPKSVTAAANNGTTRELLVAMRARIARAVEDPKTPARDLASLTKRLVEVVRDIEAIDAQEQNDGKRAADVPDADFDSSAI